MNIFHNRKHKNPEDTNKLNPVICRKNNIPQSREFVLVMRYWFNISKSFNVIHHINIKEDEKANHRLKVFAKQNMYLTKYLYPEY